MCVVCVGLCLLIVCCRDTECCITYDADIRIINNVLSQSLKDVPRIMICEIGHTVCRTAMSLNFCFRHTP